MLFMIDVPVVRAHALDAGADADLDHAGADLVGHVDAGLQARRALAVEGADGRGVGQAGHEGGGAHLGSATTGGQHLTHAHILHQRRVDARSLEQAPQRAGHQVGGRSVLEATLATLGEGGAEAGRHDNLEFCGVIMTASLSTSASSHVPGFV
jgi:hypothetical protein